MSEQIQEPIQEITIEDAIKSLPMSQRVPIVAIFNQMKKRQVIQNDQEKDISKIREKYKRLCQPLYERAAQILRGSTLKKQQIQQLSGYLKTGQSMPSPIEGDKYKGKIIQEFWPSVINNSILASCIKESDQKALSYILSISVLANPEGSVEEGVDSTSLKFVFKNNNPYFQQTQVTRTLKIRGPQFLCIEGQQVTWKQLGKNLRYQMKKVTNKKTNQTKTIQGSKIASLFDIFQDQNQQNMQDLQRCGQIMNSLASDIVKYSASYFLGVIQADIEQDEDDQDDQYEDDEGLEQRNVPNKKRQ